MVEDCTVNVSGVKVLGLFVHVIGGRDGARAVWLDPRLTGPAAEAIRQASGRP